MNGSSASPVTASPASPTARPSAIRGDLGRRLELLPMDGRCEDISVSLYLLADASGATIHSYARSTRVPARLAWLTAAMRLIGGLDGEGPRLAFTCGAFHERAARRVFLEACKLDPTVAPVARPLAAHDPRTNQAVSVAPLGGGAYRVASVPGDPTAASRAPAVAAGLAKLAELEPDADDETVVRFACGSDHDALVGLLLPRAINVRAALREQELVASRGVLVAPSAQEGAAP